MPVEGLAGHTKFLAQLTDLSTGLTHRSCCKPDFGWGHFVGPAAFAAPDSGGGQSGFGAFGYQFTFELGQRGEDPEDQFARGSGGVNGRSLAGEHLEPNATFGQVMDDVDQVTQVPT